MLRKVGSGIIWLGGFYTGLQVIWYAISAGAATIVAAPALLLKAPLIFQGALFLGICLLAFGVFNHLIVWVMERTGQAMESTSTPQPRLQRRNISATDRSYIESIGDTFRGKADENIYTADDARVRSEGSEYGAPLESPKEDVNDSEDKNDDSSAGIEPNNR